MRAIVITFMIEGKIMEFSQIKTQITKRMKEKNIHQEVIDDYLSKVKKVQEGYLGKIKWSDIGDLSESDYIQLENLEKANSISDKISKFAIIKLNGGLGTSMGLSKAKSLIDVKDNQNFIGIIKNQIEILRKKYNAPIPLLFMNSFNTREDTLNEPGIKNLNSNVHGDIPVDFLQNMVPRIYEDTLLPAWDGSSASHWCPPGHGDIFLSLKITKILDKLIAAGFTTVFLSNGDNLGATFDERILNYFIEEKLDFMPEVTPKLKADLKGGVLYKTLDENDTDGSIELLETAQVEEEYLKDFEDITRFAYFNINNLWCNLESLRDRMKKGDFQLSLIRNPKEIDNIKILQLETAMGSAVGKFNNTRVLIVPRTRFAPVKKCSDLLVRRSDIFVINANNGALIKNPQRELEEPTVILDFHYNKVQDFENFFRKIPSLLNMTSLEVSGKVLFDEKIEIKGKVKIINNSKETKSIQLANKKVFENETIKL